MVDENEIVFFANTDDILKDKCIHIPDNMLHKMPNSRRIRVLLTGENNNTIPTSAEAIQDYE